MCSGQMINKEKSSVMFSPNPNTLDINKRIEVMNILDINKDTMDDRYLGLPIYVGQSRTKAFIYSMDKIWQNMCLLGQEKKSRLKQ